MAKRGDGENLLRFAVDGRVLVMKKQIYFILLLLVTIGIQGCAKQTGLNGQDDPLPSDEEEEVIVKTLCGVCRQNLQRVNYSKVVEIANNIVKNDIPAVRINALKNKGSIEQVIHNINTFSQKGVKVLLEQPMWMEMFPEDYEQIPGPNFNVYKMSDIDLDRFRSFINGLLEQVALHTPEDALIGFELFNEANWGDFNGDLQPTSDGKGEIFMLDTPLDKPSFADIYAGIGKYGKCLEITRTALDTHFPKKNVKLISTGLVSSGYWDNFHWQINRGISLVLPDMFLTILQGKHSQQQDKTNYLRFADAIGLHSYPPLEDDMVATLNNYYFDPINAVLDEPMPFWLTEWGFSRNKFENNGGEAKRLQYFRSFIQAIETTGNTETAFLFDFDLNDGYRIWEDGALLESGKIFQEIKINQ